MLFKYAGREDEYLYGLPPRDLDSDELTEQEKFVLAVAVERGLYLPQSSSAAPAKTTGKHP